MFYRENGQFKSSYRADAALFPVAQDRWALLALSGGQPLTVHGEWDGSSLRPLTAVSPEGFWIWTPRA